MKKPNRNNSSLSSPFPSPTSVLPVPGINTDSRMISKLTTTANNNNLTTTKPPKIRIIHIFAPEIIKTDAANFRELVQRLTGNPTHLNHHPQPNRKSNTNTCSNKLPPLMMQYSGGRDNEEDGGRYRDEKEARAASQYSGAYSDGNDSSSSSLLFDNNNGGVFGFEFLAKESRTSGRIVKEEAEGSEELGGGTYFGELDDGSFIEEVGEFPLLDQNHHHHQQLNYSHHRYLNHHLQGFGSEATQFA